MAQRFARLFCFFVAGTPACFDADAYCFREECNFGGQAGASAPGGQPGQGGDTVGGNGGAPQEDNCLNGLDDDADGDVDCADGDCQPDYECVPAPAVGFDGLLYMAEAAYDPAELDSVVCPDGKLSATFFAGPSPAECTPCDCSFAGATCSGPGLQWNQGSCGGTWLAAGNALDLSCYNISTSDTGPRNYRINAGPTLLDAGTCETSGGVLGSPEPWATTVQLCEAGQQGGGCGAQAECVHKPPAAFESLYCIKQAGEVSCPPGWLNRDFNIYGNGTDSRSCDGCACELPLGCEGGKYTINAGTDCLPPPGPGTTAEITDATCTNVFSLAYMGDFEISIEGEAGTPTGAQCTQSVASGEVAITGSEKVCCRGGGL